MDICIRNKWVSIKGSSEVKDLDGKDLYKVMGKFFTITQKKFVQDLDGKTLYTVRNKFWSFFVKKALIIGPDGKEVARMRRKYFSVHDRYFINSPYGKIEICGNILCFNYRILLDDKEIGHVARKISLRDSFVLTIDDNLDIPFFISLVIGIDLITDRRKDSEVEVNDTPIA